MVLTLQQEIDNLNFDKGEKIAKCLIDLPPEASEAIVDSNFIAISFLESLGFFLQERIPQFKTLNTNGKSKPVDYALRHNTDDDIFVHTKIHPHVLVELKGRDINLTDGTPGYKATLKQLKGYLLASNCKSAQWGIITNSKHIQLFRKHGKVIYPATPCLQITPENIGDFTYQIRKKIENTPRALTIAVYNNKGGVGKTTTVTNLAAVLTRHNKKVLVVDFDANQRDFTNSLEIEQNRVSFFEWLEDRKNIIDYHDVICSYSKTFVFTKSDGSKQKRDLTFDILPVDDKLFHISEDELRKTIKVNALKRNLDCLKSNYDYIIIDSSPNWNFFSKSSIQASDVVLIPTKPNNPFSLQNAAITIEKYIPEVQQDIQKSTNHLSFGAIALPIFFNGEKEIFNSNKSHDAAIKRVQEIVDNILNNTDFNLQPYFYPQGKHKKIFELPNHASISNASFDRVPAGYKSKIAYSYYTELAKEYFLQ